MSATSYSAVSGYLCLRIAHSSPPELQRPSVPVNALCPQYVLNRDVPGTGDQQVAFRPHVHSFEDRTRFAHVFVFKPQPGGV